MKNHFSTILAVFGGCLILALFWSCFSGLGPKWPDISEAEKTELLSSMQDWRNRNYKGEIKKEYWTPALIEMNPVYVEFDGRQMKIIISGGGIGPGWGYYITETGGADSKGERLVPSKDLRFQKFRQRQ